ATPLLLPSPTAALLSFFGYQTILIAATIALAARRGWPLLNAVSYCFTIVTLAVWGDRFYAPSMYLTVEAVLTAYCALYVVIRQRLAVRWSARILYYVASIAILAPHPTALLVYLVALTIVTPLISSRVGEPVRFVLWLVVAVPLLFWCAVYGTRERLVAGVAAAPALYVIYLDSHHGVPLLP